MSRIRHIVIFLLKPEANVDEVLNLLRPLRTSADVIELTAEQSLDSRKGIVVVENALFKDEAALERFKKSKQHKDVGEHMSRLADWLVADYVEPS